MVECPVKLDTIPLFVRAGAVIPLGHGATRATVNAETRRECMVFPLAGDGASESWLFEDDGESESSPYSLLSMNLVRQDAHHYLHVTQHGNRAPTFATARLHIVGEVTTVSVDGKAHRSGDDIPI